MTTIPITFPILLHGTDPYLGRPPAEEQFAPPRRAGAVEVCVSETALVDVARRVEHGEWAEPAWHSLALDALELSVRPGLDRLMIEEHCRERWHKVGLVPYPYQLRTCRRVIHDMRGRAILADEVGLGKTIEAGMILKEYMLRGTVRRAIILAPASLTWQWQMELREKFGIPAVRQRSEYDWERCSVIVASLDTAKRSPHRDIIHALDYDLLIVDEAHRLKNARTENWRFVSAIRRKYCLLLTATPVQNDLRELYNLVTLLVPGTLGTYRQFQNRFMVDRRTPRNADLLRDMLRTCIVRNERGPDTIQFPPRRAYAVPVQLSSAERRFYDEVTRFVREQYKRSGGGLSGVLPLITLQRELCSSAPAAMSTLQALYRRTERRDVRQNIADLLTLGNDVVDTSSKCDELLQLIEDSDEGEQYIVFTEYRMTQQYIRWRLGQAGISSLGFDGSMSASKKEWTRQLFRYGARVLVSTESGGEGLNFQFCRNVINFDLPWNPMRLEQRIGRVHRLGQTRDVRIYNMATRNTIEEYILALLHEKLNMFHAVVGDVDVIFARLKMDRSFEQAIADIVLDSADGHELAMRLDELGDRVREARDESRATELLDRILR